METVHRFRQSKFEAVLLHQAVLLHLLLTPLAHAYRLKETYETMELVVYLIKYLINYWNICGGLKMIGFLVGLQIGYKVIPSTMLNLKSALFKIFYTATKFFVREYHLTKN